MKLPAALLVAAALTGCGTSSRSAPAAVLHGSLRLADCSDWHAGNKASRELTILRLRSFFGSDVTAGNAGGQHGSGPVLENGRAYRLFEKICAQSFAAAFKLYKLYGRAAGFSGTAR